MRSSLVLLASLLAAAPLAAQQAATSPHGEAADGSTRVPVRGRVIHAGTGEPVVRARLTRGSRTEALTDSTGAFLFCATPGDTLQLNVQAQDLRPASQTVVVHPRDTTRVVFAMEHDPLRRGVYLEFYEDHRPSGPPPLLIVDGVRRVFPARSPGSERRCDDPVTLDLHPEDIERIEVVKAPEAVERFGCDALHGVILITTKPSSRTGRECCGR